MKLRFATNADQQQVIDLIDRTYREYGEVICLEDADRDLLDIEGNYAGRDGAFWVLDDAGQVVGTHAAHPHREKEGVCTFRRLYLDARFRGTDWGRALMDVTLVWAREQGFRRVEFWSDTRFHRAHRFFRKLGFTSTGEVRTMHDGFEPYDEYFFYLDLNPEQDVPSGKPHP